MVCAMVEALVLKTEFTPEFALGILNKGHGNWELYQDPDLDESLARVLAKRGV